MTALLATYADIKTVKTRGVYQVVFEGPIEEMGKAFALLGAPQPASEVWVGIARLDPKKLQAPAEPEALPAPRKSGGYAQQSGILCNEGAFQRWVAERTGSDTGGADAAAAFIRIECGVVSRSELNTDEGAGRKFRDMRADYEVWLKDLVPA